MLLKFINKVPIINSLLSFNYDSHRFAFKKFFTLWCLSTLPIMFAILFSPVPSGDLSLLGKLFNRFADSISISEVFVYTAAFMAPIFYIIFERMQSMENEDPISDKFKESFKSIFKGYSIVFFLACVVLMLTATIYTSNKTSPEGFEGTFLFNIIDGYEYVFYIFALYCWYMSILSENGTVSNFIDSNRDNEKNVTKAFGNRVKQRSEGHE